MPNVNKNEGVKLVSNRIVLFPIEKTSAWRAIETACLRAANGHSIAMSRIRAYLRREFPNVPKALLDSELERVRDYINKTMSGRRVRQSVPKSAEIVWLPEPPPAA